MKSRKIWINNCFCEKFSLYLVISYMIKYDKMLIRFNNAIIVIQRNKKIRVILLFSLQSG